MLILSSFNNYWINLFLTIAKGNGRVSIGKKIPAKRNIGEISSVKK